MGPPVFRITITRPKAARAARSSASSAALRRYSPSMSRRSIISPHWRPMNTSAGPPLAPASASSTSSGSASRGAPR